MAAASAAGVDSYLTITADEVSDIPFIKAAIGTFLVLDVLGVVALILVLVVAIVYLQARQRSRIVATALSTRMGLRPGTMRRSLVLELSILLFGALAVGATTGLIGAAIVTPYLDPLPTIPPDPISVVPWFAVASAAVGLGVAAFAGGWLAPRARRTRRSTGRGASRCGMTATPFGAIGSSGCTGRPPARCTPCTTCRARSRTAPSRRSSVRPEAGSLPASA